MFKKLENLGHQPEAPKTHSAMASRCMALATSLPLIPLTGPICTQICCSSTSLTGTTVIIIITLVRHSAVYLWLWLNRNISLNRYREFSKSRISPTRIAWRVTAQYRSIKSRSIQRVAYSFIIRVCSVYCVNRCTPATAPALHPQSRNPEIGFGLDKFDRCRGFIYTHTNECVFFFYPIWTRVTLGLKYDGHRRTREILYRTYII